MKNESVLISRSRRERGCEYFGQACSELYLNNDEEQAYEYLHLAAEDLGFNNTKDLVMYIQEKMLNK